jgi:hypothetical protein
VEFSLSTFSLENDTEEAIDVTKAEAGTITFILISDHILDQCSKVDLRSYQDLIEMPPYYIDTLVKTTNESNFQMLPSIWYR